MSIEFDVWPTDAVERMTRASALLAAAGLPSSTVRSLVLGLAEIYESDVPAELREQVAASLVVDEPVRKPGRPRVRTPRSEPVREPDRVTPPARAAAPANPERFVDGRRRVLDALARSGYERTAADSSSFQIPARPRRLVALSDERVAFLHSTETGRYQVERFSLATEVEAALDRLRRFSRE